MVSLPTILGEFIKDVYNTYGVSHSSSDAIVIDMQRLQNKKG